MRENPFDVYFQETVPHRRGNTNLPGFFIFGISDMEAEADEIDQDEVLQEQAWTGYDAAHQHSLECGPKGPPWNETRPCGKWNWYDFDQQDSANPLRTFLIAYEQVSPAENMKRSNQVALGFQAQNQQQDTLDMGGSPQLLPRPSPSSATVIINNGGKAVKEVRKGIVGLGGK